MKIFSRLVFHLDKFLVVLVIDIKEMFPHVVFNEKDQWSWVALVSMLRRSEE